MKFLLISLCILCFTLPAMSETPMFLGGQMGIHFSSLSISPSQVSWSGRTTFMVGGLFEVGLSRLFWLQPEINYVSAGAKTNYVDANNQPGTATLSSNYLEISPLAKCKFGKKDFKPYVFAGPKIGILTGATLDQTLGTQSATQDQKDNTESLNLSIQFGAGTDFNLDQSTTFFGELRYHLGLTNVNKDPTASNVSIKTSGLMILIGAKFRVD
ncbi:MAG: porin family protein [Bacteroidota bacterium]